MNKKETTQEEKLYPASKFNFKKRPLSYSTLKYMSECPLEFAHNWFKPKTPPSDAILVGSVLDVMLFDPEELDNRHPIKPKFQVGSKAGLFALLEYLYGWLTDEQKKELAPPDSADKMDDLRAYRATIEPMVKVEFVTQEIMAEAEVMLERLKAHPVAGKVINHTVQTQGKLEWFDGKSKLPLKGIYDGLAEFDDGKRVIWDLKKARDASSEGFMRQAVDLGYHIQAAAYQKGHARKTGEFLDTWYVVIKSTPPYSINVLRASDEYMALGNKHYRENLDKVRYCIENDTFDEDYLFLQTNEYNMLSIPAWKRKELDE